MSPSRYLSSVTAADRATSAGSRFRIACKNTPAGTYRAQPVGDAHWRAGEGAAHGIETIHTGTVSYLSVVFTLRE